MSRKPDKKGIKVPRKVAVRRSAYKDHRNKYSDFSKFKHNPFGVYETK